MSGTAEGADVRLSPEWLRTTVTRIFEATGLSSEAAALVADQLVESDMAGVGSHGVLLVPMYVERLRAGSVSREERAVTVRDAGAVAVLDAQHALGQLTAIQSMEVAIEKARRHGVGAVAVRHAFHFGRAHTYARKAADRGCIGVAAANTRPLMPAVGGAEPVVGNNPVAVCVPGGQGPDVSLDMAMSEAALGKIRLAAAEGRPIPDTWATDASGVPTTDPAAAVDGMLLPTGGPKGFGLALVVDVLAGVLSGGAFGSDVAGLYADTSTPNDCSHFFLALDVDAFVGRSSFDAAVVRLTSAVTGSRPRPGVDRVRLPGQPERELRDRSAHDGVALSRSVLHGLYQAADLVGAALPTPGKEEP